MCGTGLCGTAVRNPGRRCYHRIGNTGSGKGSGGWRLRGSVSGEDKEQLSAGKEVEITLPSSEKRILKIESVENAEDTGMLHFYIPISFHPIRCLYT